MKTKHTTHSEQELREDLEEIVHYYSEREIMFMKDSDKLLAKQSNQKFEQILKLIQSEREKVSKCKDCKICKL